jgi:2-oxoglutarate ferredoxin oxidoreductase subunit beta
MNKLYEKYIKTDSLPTLFCPGCGNGIIQIAAMNAMESLGIKDEVACVSGIGCSSWIPCYFDLDVMHTMHGRALAFAEGLKLAQPDKKIMVFTGDGDCLAIGGNHLMHAAARNIDLTVVMVNNYIYGMTGGQMAPTTLVGMKATTAPKGRDPQEHGYPMHMSEIINQLTAPYYIERVSCDTPQHVIKARNAIKKAFKYQMEGRGYSIVEIVTSCPTNWGLDTLKSLDFLREKMFAEYPLGVFRDKGAEEK